MCVTSMDFNRLRGSGSFVLLELGDSVGLGDGKAVRSCVRAGAGVEGCQFDSEAQ